MAKAHFADDEELKDAAADIVGRGQRVRERTRDLLVNVLKGKAVAPSAVQNVVHEVMGGAIEALEDAVPSERSGTLRQVMTGVGDAIAVVGASSRRAADTVAQHGRELQHDMVPLLQRATSDASRQVLSAMSRFSRRLSGSLRDEIETMVAEARRTGLDLAPVAKRTAKAAASDPVGLASDTMHAGMRLAGSAAAQLMSATGGMLSGIGEAVAAVSGEAKQRKSPSTARTTKAAKKAAVQSKARSKKKAKGQKKKAGDAKASGGKPSGGTSTAAGKKAASKKASTKTTARKTAVRKTAGKKTSGRKVARVAKTSAGKGASSRKAGRAGKAKGTKRSGARSAR